MALMESVDLFEIILERIGDGVMLIGPDGGIAAANPACAAILGYSQESLLGLPFISLVLSEELAVVTRDHDGLWAGEPLPPRMRRFARKDGTIVTARVEECIVETGAGEDRVILAILKDLTRSIETATALHDSQQQLRAIFGNTEDAVYIKDASGCYLTINPSGARMFGRPAIDILFRDDRFLFGESDAEEIRALDRLVTEHAEVHQAEAAYEIEGRRRVFSTVRLPFFDQSGKVTGVLGISRDITEQKEIEGELQETVRRYRALVDGNTDGVIVTDLAGAIEDVSDRAAALLGYAAADLHGQDFDGLVASGERSEHRENLAALADGAPSLLYEINLTRSNGSKLPVEIDAGVVLDAAGEPRQFQILFRDISERKRVDLERANLLESLRERTAQIQTAFEVSTSIASTLDLTNLLNQTVEIIKQRFSFYYVGVFLVQEGYAVLAAGSGAQGKRLLETGHRLAISPDSMVGWSLVNRRPRLASDAGKDFIRFANPMLPETRSELAMPLIVHGEPIGALTVQSEYPSAFTSEDVAVLQIIADQLGFAVQNARLHARLAAYAGDLEKRVHYRTSQLEILNKDLEAFSYSISHDLRTPLRAVKGYTGILLEDHAGELSPEAREYLEKIKTSAARMGDLIEDILAFSRLGRQRIRKVQVETGELVREVLEDHAGEIDRRAISVEIAPLSPVYADRSLLRQVLANLVSNAVKFTRDVPEARLRIGETETDRGRAIFVADNGVGFDPASAERLFGVFQRLHSADRFDGSGVGLAIVQRIVERHGGEVWFEAGEGEGATFYFSLPAGEE